MEETKILSRNNFPLGLSSKGDFKSLITYLTNNHDDLDNKLRQHSGILLRDSGIKTSQDFHDVIIASGYKSMEYIGGAAVRTQITERVFTANESPSSENIPYHHEMAQTPQPPTHLFFFCEVAPTEGGETPILLSYEVYDKMKLKNPLFLEQLETYGVQYIRYLPEYDDHTSAIGRGWRSTYLTETKEGAEAALIKQGSTWEWQPDGTLKTVTAILPAIRTDSGVNRTNRKIFFNSVVAAYSGWNDSRNIGEKAVVLGDGKQTVCDPQGIKDIIAIMEECTVAIPWQAGDVLLLDNRTAMHSRRPFSGPRRILASLVRDGDR